MQKRAQLFLSFLIFLFLSIVCIVLFRTHAFSSISDGIQVVFSPFRKGIGSENSEIEKVKKENLDLRKRLKDEDILKKENSALRDQFETNVVSSRILIPAQIVGLTSFIPHISEPENMVIDKGSRDGVKAGSVVIFKDNLVGVVKKSTSHFSEVELLQNIPSSFTAKTRETNALGSVESKNGNLILGNVVNADMLKKNDLVVTKGELNGNGEGFPHDVIIGKISAVHKKASDLFQTAEIKSLVDVTTLQMVFVIK